MKQVGLFFFGFSLLVWTGCAERPGKKKPEKAEEVVTESKKMSTKANEKSNAQPNTPVSKSKPKVAK